MRRNFVSIGPARTLALVCAVPALIACVAVLVASMSPVQALIDAAAAAVGTAVCVARGRYGDAPHGPQGRTAAALESGAPLVAPAATIAGFAAWGDSYLPWAMASAWVLVVAAGVFASSLRRRSDAVIVLAVSAAAIGSPAGVTDTEEAMIFGLGIAVPVITSIGIGLLIRSNRRKLVAERAEALAKERTAMAHELHDVIAHEITGMVVLAQAGAMASDGATKTTFAHIEQSGRRALVDVRSMVSTLREPGESGTAGVVDARLTVGDAGSASSLCQELAEVAGRFADSTRAQVEVDIARELDSPGIGPRAKFVALRVLTEGLTNIRRHAADATHVSVTAELDATGAIELALTDDGSGGGAGLGSGNGFGLESLSARVTEIGGTLNARALPGRGFELRATLPQAGKAEKAGKDSE